MLSVADYIPALADVPAQQLGIAVYGNDGNYYCAGDALVPFSVMLRAIRPPGWWRLSC